jgi:hypothetical protein
MKDKIGNCDSGTTAEAALITKRNFVVIKALEYAETHILKRV